MKNSRGSLYFSHHDPLALLLHWDDLMVFVVSLYALCTDWFLVCLAKLLQELVVNLAEVTNNEGAWVCQHVPCQQLIL